MKYLLFIFFLFLTQNSNGYEYRNAPFKDCTKLQAACFDPKTSPQDPYFLANPFVMKAANSKKVVVLVHGITDSPYTWRDISLFLNQAGYNVYAVLLTGHGDKPEALLEATNKDWIKDIANIMDLALKETENAKTVLVGFSMGANLITEMAALPEYKNLISSIVLLAPAYKIQSFWGNFLCNLGVAEFITQWARHKEGSVPWAYKSMPTRSVCEIVNMGKFISTHVSDINVPVFAAINETDEDVVNDDTLDLINEMKSPTKEVFYARSHIAPLSKGMISFFQYQTPFMRHSDLPYKKDLLRTYKNPVFDQMMEKIKEFLNIVGN